MVLYSGCFFVTLNYFVLFLKYFMNKTKDDISLSAIIVNKISNHLNQL